MSYSSIGTQNYFNCRYKSIFERFKKLSLVIVLHKQSVRGNYLLGDLLWDLLKITGGLSWNAKSNLNNKKFAFLVAQSKKISEYNFPIELFVVGNKYSRDDIYQISDKGRIDGFKGITEFSNCFALVVTLEKKDKPKNQKYKDFFKNKREFFWESQQPGINSRKWLWNYL